MVKKWIIMSVITLAIIGLCVWENIYIQKSFEFLDAKLTKIEAQFEADELNVDSAKNINDLEALHKEWQKKTDILKMIVWHTGMKEVEINLSRITSYAEQNNFEEAMVELHALQDFCEHYKNDFTITPENIL